MTKPRLTYLAGAALVLALQAAVAPAARASADGSDTPSPIATLTDTDNLVRIVRGTSGDILAGEDEMELFEGDSIETLEHSTATITFMDDHIINLGENSHLVLESLRPPTVTGGFFGRVRLLGGQLVASLEKLTGDGAGFEVATPTAIAAVKGTTFSVDAADTGGTVSVLEGTVATSAVRADGSRGEAVMLGEMQTSEVAAADRRPTRPRRFAETGRWAGMRQRLMGIRAAAVERRRMKHSGELGRTRRLRILSRAAHVMQFMRRHPRMFAALPAPQRAHLQQFVRMHEAEVARSRPEIAAFERAHPEWKAKLDRFEANRGELHKRRRVDQRDAPRERPLQERARRSR